jgi:alpha-glucosidase (family GH31 glycosyl hydrolase)
MSEVIFTVGARIVRARFLLPNAVRITHAPPGQLLPPDRPWLSHVLLPTPEVKPEDRLLRVDVDALNVRVTSHDASFTLHESQPPRFGKDAGQLTPGVAADIPAFQLRLENDRSPEAVSLAWRIEPGEGFYGWGEWFNAFRRERGQLKLKIRDAIALLQHRETYSAIPVFYSSRGYGIFLLNSHPSRWTIDPERGTLSVDAAGPNADYIVMYGPSLRELIRTYTQLTGRPLLPPRWAFGLMVTGYPQEAQDKVLAFAREHRRRNLPLDALILDYHWEERFHNFRWRRSLFPNPQSLISDLQSSGIRLGLILTPFQNNRRRPAQKFVLNRLAHNVSAGVYNDDERAPVEYAEGKAKGYFAHDDAPWWFGAGGMVDFTNPAAARWFNDLMRPRYEEGVAFFKNDDGEYLPMNARSHIGMSGREYHNLYGFFYSRALFEGMAELDERRPFVYARSAWAGSQRFPALFLGDQHPTFEHIRRTMRAGLNLGLLGFAHWTADVFGLDGKTTPETHARYAQWALLNPIARYFIRPPQFDDTRFPWSHGPQIEANFRAYTELRYRLLPYYYALAWEAHRTGLPPLRPLRLEFEEPRFDATDDQVMLGPALLIAPVLVGGATERTIQLPGGIWHDFWTTQSYAGGGTVNYPAPLDRLPMLVRGGSLLPFGPVTQFIPDDHRFDELELHGYPPYPAAFTLYDDDGCTRAYQRGEFWTTDIRITGDEDQVKVTIERTEGRYPADAAPRRVTVVLHRAAVPRGVRANGEPWPHWEHDAETQTVRVRVECPLTEATVIEVT